MIDVVGTGYEDALASLRTDIVAMGEAVLGRLADALDALTDRDLGLARTVADGDAQINEMALDIEATCLDLFGRQEPLAGDLRFVAASFKIVTDLERVGDLAVNLAEYTLSDVRDVGTEIDAYGIGSAAQTLLGDALAAYEADDPTACRTVAARDDDIDARCQHASAQVVRDLLERDPDAWSVERVLDAVGTVLLTIRDLERIGDHAVNIAARTHFVLDGDPELIR
ncbi:MAG: phosphate signaling complex protein PhoU [Halococcoides sp.]